MRTAFIVFVREAMFLKLTPLGPRCAFKEDSLADAIEELESSSLLVLAAREDRVMNGKTRFCIYVRLD